MQRNLLRAIGNSIGKFICLDERSCKIIVTTVARVCVEVYLTEGLPDNIVIEAGKWCYNNILDYVNIPFRCSFCHSYGHLYNCAKSIRSYNSGKRNSINMESPLKIGKDTPSHAGNIVGKKAVWRAG